MLAALRAFSDSKNGAKSFSCATFLTDTPWLFVCLPKADGQNHGDVRASGEYAFHESYFSMRDILQN